MSLITFEQIKQKCIESYNNIEGAELYTGAFQDATTVTDLMQWLDELGYDNEEAVNFIFEAIMINEEDL